MDIGIVGVGQSVHASARHSVSLSELIFESTKAALDDAGMSRADVDAVVIAAHDLVDGRGISSMITATAAGGHFRDEIRVADDGAYAFALACMRILSGEFRTVLVASWAKCSESPIDTVENLGCDPVYQRPIGLTNLSASALQADRYAQQYGITDRQAAAVVARSRRYGLKNPQANIRRSVTIEDVIGSPMVATPLHALDVPPRSDGSCALVLRKSAASRDKRSHTAWIRGMGWAIDPYFLGDRGLNDLRSTKSAAMRAYSMAGILSPDTEFDVAELQSASSYHELMLYQALGLCESGKSGDFAEALESATTSALAINPSGGTFCANPYTASGLVRIAEAALQVMHRAGDRQVNGASIALAHACSGLAAQSNAVFVLSSQLAAQ